MYKLCLLCDMVEWIVECLLLFHLRLLFNYDVNLRKRVKRFQSEQWHIAHTYESWVGIFQLN